MSSDIVEGEQYGWRMWIFSPKFRMLMPPMTWDQADPNDVAARMARTTTVTAECAHGSTPPSAECVCGVHFVEGTANFIETVRWLQSGEYEVQIDRAIVVATFGRAVGPVLLDYREGEKWSGERPFRAGTF